MEPVKIVIVGGGYGGLACMRKLNRLLSGLERDVLLIDASTHHAIKSRFHERAVMKSRELGVRYPLDFLARGSNARFRQDEILSIDLERRLVAGTRGEYPYDALVLAPGGRSSFFDIPGAREHTYPIDTLEAVERSAEAVAGLLGAPASEDGGTKRIVVCGAGIEGVEVAAQARQLAGADKLSITMLEGAQEVLAAAPFPEERALVERHLADAGVELMLGSRITGVGPEGVKLADGTLVGADLVLWCAGIRPVKFAGLEAVTPFTVTPYLHHAQYTEVFGVGDFALVNEGDRYANLASAQRAVYQGALAADNLAAQVLGKVLVRAAYRPVGELVALGDWNGAGVVLGKGIGGLGAALLKKANELKYVAELHADLGRTVALAAVSPLRKALGKR